MLQTICKLNVFLVLMNSTALICECIRAEAGRFYFMLSDFNWFIIVMSVQIILTINFSSNRQLNIFGGDLTFSCHYGQGSWYYDNMFYGIYNIMEYDMDMDIWWIHKISSLIMSCFSNLSYLLVIQFFLPLRLEQLNVYDRFSLQSKTFLTSTVLKNSKKHF